MSVKHENVTVRLVGEDGNAFNIIASVTGALRRDVDERAAQEYAREALASDSYDALLALTARTVYVT